MCKRWPLYCLGSVCSLCIHLVASIQTSSDVFLLWGAHLSHDTDVWADAGGLTSVMRTPSYEWWHPVRALASEGQIDKLFSLKFCINMGSDGSTWEGLIHATTMRGQGVVSKPWVDREVLISWWRGKLLLIMAKLLIGKLLSGNAGVEETTKSFKTLFALLLSILLTRLIVSDYFGHI